MRRKQCVLENALTLIVIIEIVTQHRVLPRETIHILHETFYLLGYELQVCADLLRIEPFQLARKGLFLDFQRCEVLHGRPPGTYLLKSISP